MISYIKKSILFSLLLSPFSGRSQNDNYEQSKTFKQMNASAKETAHKTEIATFDVVYKDEDYHQNYYNENGEQPYCQFVVRPKLEKFKNVFKDKLKSKN